MVAPPSANITTVVYEGENSSSFYTEDSGERCVNNNVIEIKMNMRDYKETGQKRSASFNRKRIFGEEISKQSNSSPVLFK